MDIEIEKKFIESFIIDRKRERALYELGNNKKRDNFIWDMTNGHCIDKRYIKKITEPVSSSKIVYDILKKNGAPDNCYILGISGDINGKTLPLKEALEKVINYEIVIISCIHGHLAYMQGEQNPVKPDRYLLIK